MATKNLKKIFVKDYLKRSKRKRNSFAAIVGRYKKIVILNGIRQDSNLGPIHYECTALTN